ncbi:putative phosphotransferase PWA37_001894 [Arxiozyma heterogenica]|uniref:Ribitol kinase n=1 Tax=Arxiozyma heterogenica TaxID=278026 RepID=A0AAN7WS28_9SACH|nr:hypothetical protein RI543_001369 [Kazachstania heterogenica]
MDGYYIGVDVGTGSVRACLVHDHLILTQHELEIPREELKPGYITQSSTSIWNSVCQCVRNTITESNIDPKDILGIGFDATCSLVVVDKDTGLPLAVGPDFSDNDQNIIMWMDHRARKETDFINSTQDKCLKYVGGKMSVEMELPKIKWLKAFRSIKNAKFFDLPDYLTYKATGKETRSLCSAVCKQGMLPSGSDGSVDGWSTDFLEKIGLNELIEDNFFSLGGSLKKKDSFLSAGQPVGCLSKVVADDMGLTESCIVSSGIIDAYAGWIGTVASIPLNFKKNSDIKRTERLAMVAGTSTCHIIMADRQIMVPGVWGPYKDILLPDFWVTEGGQSCTGALLNHILTTHPSYKELIDACQKSNQNPYDYLNNTLIKLLKEKSCKSVSDLTSDLFMYGDLHGNRSPLADMEMRAVIIGQTLDTSIESLSLLYLAACEFIALQTRHIIETMINSGHCIKAIYISGSQVNNDMLIRLMMESTGLDIIIPEHKTINKSSSTNSAVAYGSAILGMCAYKIFSSNRKDVDKHILWDVMTKATPAGKIYSVEKLSNDYEKGLLNVKYNIYLDMIKTQRKYRDLVKKYQMSN